MSKNAIIVAILSLQFFSCNFYKDFADTESREARVEEAKIQIDKGDYVTAIYILEDLFADYPADPEIATLRSSAYAGAAGIGIMDIAFNMADMAISNNPIDRPFEVYLGFVTSPTQTEMEYALYARNSLIAFSADPAARTNEMNMFLTVLSYGIVASILSARSDINPNDNNADAGFDCSSVSDDDAREAVYTYAVARESAIEADGSSLWDGVADQVTGFTDVLDGLGIDMDINSKSDVSLASCSMMKAFMVAGLLGSEMTPAMLLDCACL